MIISKFVDLFEIKICISLAIYICVYMFPSISFYLYLFVYHLSNHFYHFSNYFNYSPSLLKCTIGSILFNTYLSIRSVLFYLSYNLILRLSLSIASFLLIGVEGPRIYLDKKISILKAHKKLTQGFEKIDTIRVDG